MISILYEFIGDNYTELFCLAILAVFLMLNKQISNRLRVDFAILGSLVLVEVLRYYHEGLYNSDDSYTRLRLVITCLGFISRPAIELFLCMVMSRHHTKKMRYFLLIPIIVDAVVVLLIPFTDVVIRIEGNELIRGPLGFIPTVVMTVYLIIIVNLLCETIKRSRWEFVMVFTCAIFGIFNLIDGLVFSGIHRLQGITMTVSILTYFTYICSQKQHDQIDELGENFHETEEKLTTQMIDQSIETLAYTIDAKDEYTRGHSFRVAKYSRMLAKMAGKSDRECREIYLSALLHDIGKIGVPENIIDKNGKLTADEYESIKKHPENGAKILEKMKSIPYLSDGAKYHHERYDGTGYPQGISGKDIPEAARIIAVADAYDAMTSQRSYRAAMDQSMVRQEIWKGVGTQFDPYYAKIMVSIIDSDVEYNYREKEDDYNTLRFESTPVERRKFAEPVRMSAEQDNLLMSKQHFFVHYIQTSEPWVNPAEYIDVSTGKTFTYIDSVSNPKANRIWHVPAIIVYMSPDGMINSSNYKEVAVIKFTGYCWRTPYSSKTRTQVIRKSTFSVWENWLEKNIHGVTYELSTDMQGNILHINIDAEDLLIKADVTINMIPGNNVYLALSGENCQATVRKTEEKTLA